MDIVRRTDALLAVDVQNDFCPGGALPVEDGDSVVPEINRLLPLFSTVVYTRDWHPPDHVSFADPPLFADGSWPPHCVQGTAGAEFHPDLKMPPGVLIVNKGDDPAAEAYSGFQAREIDLEAWLRGRGVERVFVAGLATDYCVLATSLDARRAGFDVVLLEDAVRGVAPDSTRDALEELRQSGVGGTTAARLATSVAVAVAVGADDGDEGEAADADPESPPA